MIIISDFLLLLHQISVDSNAELGAIIKRLNQIKLIKFKKLVTL